MDEKLTFREKVVAVFIVFIGILSVLLFALLWAVRFNGAIEIWLMDVLGVESRQEVTTFIRWRFFNLLMFLFVVVFNWDVVAQIANKSMKSMKDIWRRLFVRILRCVGGIGWVFFIVLLFVMFNDRVEYWAKVILGVESKRNIINFIGWSISWILVFFILTTVIKWVALQVENNMEEMNELWRRIIFWFLLFVGALGLGLFILLVMVLFVADVEDWATKTLGILGDMSKQEVIEFISLGIAGILAFFGAVAVNRRATAQAKVAESQFKAAESQVEIAKSQVKVSDAQVQAAESQVENNKLIERGHIQERFKVAVEHMGNEHESMRIASFYEFFRLASDNEELRKDIFDILRAHLRRITTDGDYREEVIKNKRTTEEVQCLLDALFRSKDIQGKFVFAELKPTLLGIFLMRGNLYRACLRRAILKKMELQSANLYKADLREATLWKVDLQGADLCEADLRGAVLRDIVLQNAKLQGVKLQGAKLLVSDLRGVDLRNADLRGTDFRGTILSDAKLQEANLQGANLEYADLYRAKLYQAKLQGAKLRGTNFRDADLRCVDLCEANLEDTNFQGADLQSADLRDAKLRFVVLAKADLRGAKLQGAKLSHVNLEGVDLRGADLEGADLQGANLEGADLRRIDFRGMDLWGVILQSANLWCADLRGVNLRSADLRRANLEMANLSGAKIKGAKFSEGYEPPADADTTSDD